MYRLVKESHLAKHLSITVVRRKRFNSVSGLSKGGRLRLGPYPTKSSLPSWTLLPPVILATSVAHSSTAPESLPVLSVEQAGAAACVLFCPSSPWLINRVELMLGAQHKCLFAPCLGGGLKYRQLVGQLLRPPLPLLESSCSTMDCSCKHQSARERR